MKDERDKGLQEMLRHFKSGDSKKAMDALKRAMPEEVKKNPVITQAERHMSKFSEANTPESKNQAVLETTQFAEETLKSYEHLNVPAIQALAAHVQNVKVQHLSSPSEDTEQTCRSLEEGLDTVTKQYGKESEDSAKFFLSTAGSFFRLGKNNRSCELVDSALTILKKEPVRNALFIGEGHILLAGNYFALKEVNKSHENACYALEVLTTSADQGAKHQEMIAQARVLVETTRSVKTKQKQPSLAPQKISELKARALASYKKGEYVTAIKLFKACLDIYDTQKSVDENSVASTCYNLGSAYLKVHDASSARVYLNRALEIRQKKGDEEGSNKIKQLMADIEVALAVDSKSSLDASM